MYEAMPSDVPEHQEQRGRPMLTFLGGAAAGALAAVVALCGAGAQPFLQRGTGADVVVAAAADASSQSSSSASSSAIGVVPVIGGVEEDPVGGVNAPLAKTMVLRMVQNIKRHTAFNEWDRWSTEMAPFFTEDMLYDFSYMGGWFSGQTRGLRQWYEGEHMHYNRALPDCQFYDFLGPSNDELVSLASYALTRWVEPFAGVLPPASKPKVTIRDLDFYVMEGNRIKTDLCLIDVVDMFLQVGYNVLPPAPMPTLGYLAPMAMDGEPAPLSSWVDPKDTVAAEKVWLASLQEDYVLNTGDARWWSDDMVWYGPGGVGTARSSQDYLTHWLKPLHAAFSNVTMTSPLSVCEGKYCGSHFYLHGVHTGEWLGLPATGKTVTIRCGAHGRVADGKVGQGWLIADLPYAFHTLGEDLYARARSIALAMA